MTETNVPGTIYLLHFARPFKHARHYCGWASDLENRLECHRKGYAGHASKLMAAVASAGIEWEVAATWQGLTRYDESRVKAYGSLARFCPICTGVPARDKPVKLSNHPLYLMSAA